MLLNNDVLSIISTYSNIPMRLIKNKLIINIDNKCESCNFRMRRTHKSVVEAYTFPKLWEINEEFYSETSKYIRNRNTFIFINKQMYTYEEAQSQGIINYVNRTSNNNVEQIYGGYLVINEENLKILVKKNPSLPLLYRTIKDVLGYNQEKKLLEKLKEYEKYGLDNNIIEQSLNKINVIDKPIKMAVRLCKKCRDKVKKGYIFT